MSLDSMIAARESGRFDHEIGPGGCIHCHILVGWGHPGALTTELWWSQPCPGRLAAEVDRLTEELNDTIAAASIHAEEHRKAREEIARLRDATREPMTVSELVVAILRENIAVDAAPAVIANFDGVDLTPADMIARIEAADPAALTWVQVMAAASIRFAIRRVERREVKGR